METENATTAVKIKMCVGMTAVSFIKSTISDTFRKMQFRIAPIIPMATLTEIIPEREWGLSCYDAVIKAVINSFVNNPFIGTTMINNIFVLSM